MRFCTSSGGLSWMWKSFLPRLGFRAITGLSLLLNIRDVRSWMGRRDKTGWDVTCHSEKTGHAWGVKRDRWHLSACMQQCVPESGESSRPATRFHFQMSMRQKDLRAKTTHATECSMPKAQRCDSERWCQCWAFASLMPMPSHLKHLKPILCSSSLFPVLRK